MFRNHDGTSCFVDTVLTSLLAPPDISRHLLLRDNKQTTEHHEMTKALKFIRSVFDENRHIKMTSALIRSQIHDIDDKYEHFNSHSQQSAVDFLTALLCELGASVLKNKEPRFVVTKCRKTKIMINRLIEDVDITPKRKIMDEWMNGGSIICLNCQSEEIQRERLDNDDVRMIQNDDMQIWINGTNDQAHIGNFEPTLLFSCHLTSNDHQKTVSIIRDLQPTITHPVRIDGYTGEWCHILRDVEICKESSKLLFMEVNRRQLGIQKNKTLIQYGKTNPNTHNIVIMDHFVLRAVICHIGTSAGGHYVCYVYKQGKWWFHDNLKKRAVKVFSPEVPIKSSLTGEIFIYVNSSISITENDDDENDSSSDLNTDSDNEDTRTDSGESEDL